MGSIPAFLLKRLYVRGSLRNTATGFQLTIQNTLAPGTIVGLAPLQVNGAEYSLDTIKAVLPDGTQVPASGVSADSPVRFSIGDKVTMLVEAQPLPAGTHRLIISPKTKEAGRLSIEVEDRIG
jgi:hydroxymethylglutaryl-CoA reductase (NADPH)